MSVCLKEKGGGGMSSGMSLAVLKQVLTRQINQLETSKIVKYDGYLDIQHDVYFLLNSIYS